MIKTIKRRTDALYAFRFINLIRKPFEKWDAYKSGIIDNTGKMVKSNLSAEEKSKWTRFHKMTASIKQMLDRGPKRTSELTSLWLAYRTIREEFIPESDLSVIETEYPCLVECMVSGDAGGDPDKIASGQNSGSVVYPSPQGLKKKKKVKRMSEVIKFKEFIDLKEQEALRLKEMEEQERNKVIEPVSVRLKALGSNGVYVESVDGKVVKVEMCGKTTRTSLTEQDITEAFNEHGKDGLLACVKEATKLVWKFVE